MIAPKDMLSNAKGWAAMSDERIRSYKGDGLWMARVTRLFARALVKANVPLGDMADYDRRAEGSETK